MTWTLPGVEAFREKLPSLNVPIQIAFNRRYDPSHRALADAVRAGEIGDLELLLLTEPRPRAAAAAVSRGLGRRLPGRDDP